MTIYDNKMLKYKINLSLSIDVEKMYRTHYEFKIKKISTLGIKDSYLILAKYIY